MGRGLSWSSREWAPTKKSPLIVAGGEESGHDLFSLFGHVPDPKPGQHIFFGVQIDYFSRSTVFNFISNQTMILARVEYKIILI